MINSDKHERGIPSKWNTLSLSHPLSTSVLYSSGISILSPILHIYLEGKHFTDYLKIGLRRYAANRTPCKGVKVEGAMRWRGKRIFRRELCERRGRRGEYINFFEMRNQNFSTSTRTPWWSLCPTKKEPIVYTAAYKCIVDYIMRVNERKNFAKCWAFDGGVGGWGEFLQTTQNETSPPSSQGTEKQKVLQTGYLLNMAIC